MSPLRGRLYLLRYNNHQKPHGFSSCCSTAHKNKATKRLAAKALWRLLVLISRRRGRGRPSDGRRWPLSRPTSDLILLLCMEGHVVSHNERKDSTQRRKERLMRGLSTAPKGNNTDDYCHMVVDEPTFRSALSICQKRKVQRISQAHYDGRKAFLRAQNPSIQSCAPSFLFESCAGTASSETSSY